MALSNQEEFSARLARLRERETGAGPAPQARAPVHGGPGPLSLLVALALGAAAVAGGHLALFRLGVALPGSLRDMALAGGLGLVCALVLSRLFRLRAKRHLGLATLGAALMLGGFHNLMHWAPEPAARLFSAGYVAQITAASPPNSLRLGETYQPIPLPAPLLDSLMALASPPAADCAAAEPTTAAVSILTLDHGGKAAKNGHKTVRAAPAEAAPCSGS